MRVLVTGHKGYIGSVLVPMLLARGHAVSGLDCDFFSACTYTGVLTPVAETCKDIRDIGRADVEGFDVVIHLAALSNDPLGDYDPRITEAINFQASVKLARLARDAGVRRFLFASSCSNYGRGGEDILDEDATLNPVTPYGFSKVNAEREIGFLADDSFSPVFLRASTAYGISPRLRFDLVVNNLTAWAIATGKVFIKSDGTPWRPLVHVEDICRAYVAALEAPRDCIHGRAFNVGQTTENYQVREIAELVAEIVPGCRVVYADGAGPDTRSYRVDCNRLAKSLHGFKPQWTVRRGIEQLFRHLSDSGIRVEDFEGSRFQRIAHIKKRIGDGELTASLRCQSR